MPSPFVLRRKEPRGGKIGWIKGPAPEQRAPDFASLFIMIAQESTTLGNLGRGYSSAPPIAFRKRRLLDAASVQSNQLIEQDKTITRSR
jgi:hypothetical protein